MGSVPVRQHALEVRKDIRNRLRTERDEQSFTTEVIKGMSVTQELFQIAYESGSEPKCRLTSLIQYLSTFRSGLLR
jgi:hypothetical protein